MHTLIMAYPSFKYIPLAKPVLVECNSQAIPCVYGEAEHGYKQINSVLTSFV